MTVAPAPAAPRLDRIGQIAVNARDLSRATAFWRDRLGARFLFEVPGRMAFFDFDGVRVMLAPLETPEFDHASSILYFLVDDLAATHARLASAGVRFRGAPALVARMPDHELWMAFFADSEDNVLALMSEVRAGTAPGR